VSSLAQMVDGYERSYASLVGDRDAA
jgi:hypothetical protein